MGLGTWLWVASRLLTTRARQAGWYRLQESSSCGWLYSCRATTATAAAAGLQARLVHEQLSTHWRGALQHQLQQALHSGGAGTPSGPTAVAGGSGLSKLATHMQALGLGAVTAEVQEGQPGTLGCFATNMHRCLTVDAVSSECRRTNIRVSTRQVVSSYSKYRVYSRMQG